MVQSEFTDKTIVMKVGRFREIDCWVRFFSPTNGIMTAFAFGGSKSRKRFSGCLDQLNHVLFTVASNRSGNYFYLCEGTLLHRFPRIHQDLSRLGMAVNCLKFLEASHIGIGNASSVFDLLFQTLWTLNEEKFVPAYFPLFFRARIACEYGYRPDLCHCGKCGKNIGEKHKSIFFLSQGQIFCMDCYGLSSGGPFLSKEELDLLNTIFQGDPLLWSGIKLPEKCKKKILQVLDKFVSIHLGLVWDGGRFRTI